MRRIFFYAFPKSAFCIMLSISDELITNFHRGKISSTKHIYNTQSNIQRHKIFHFYSYSYYYIYREEKKYPETKLLYFGASFSMRMRPVNNIWLLWTHIQTSTQKKTYRRWSNILNNNEMFPFFTPQIHLCLWHFVSFFLFDSINVKLNPSFFNFFLSAT